MTEKTQTIRVVAAIADKTQVTLYKEDGDTLIIKQGDHRLNDLLDAIIPITTRGEVAVISLTEFSVYAAFQQKSEESGGFIKLFKVARKKLTSFFGSSETQKEEHPDAKPLSAATVGALMVAANPGQAQAEEAALAAEREDARVTEEVLAMSQEDKQALEESRQDIVDRLAQKPDTIRNAGPSHVTPVDPFPVAEAAPAPRQETLHDHLEPIAQDDQINEVEETVVAVVGSTIIPNIEKIRPLIDRALRTNSAQSIENFLKRLAPMIDKRKHSVEDVLRFLEKGDLPLAEDGSIIAYKMLNWQDQSKGVMKDCHSGNVKQKVGSYVCVDESLVDLNRHNECSNGLHIARRGYLSGFSGNVCVLCKIDPEDVVTVPHGDPNKVRVKGYHILAILPDDAVRALKSNQPMTGDKGALALVYKAIKGQHVARLEEVRVTEQMGGGLRITPIKQGTKEAIGPAANVDVKEPTQAELATAAALDDPSHVAGTVEPREINKRVNQEIETRAQQQVPATELADEPETDLTDQEDVDEDHDNDGTEDEEDSDELPDIDQEVQDAMDAADGVAPEPVKEEPVPVAKTPAEEKKLARKEKKASKRNEKAKATREAQAKAKAPVKAPAKKPETKVTAPAPIKSGTLTKADEARALYDAGKLQELREFKKRVKKGWGVLGFTDAEVEKIVPEVG